MLDQYWPGCTIDSNIKRSLNVIYTATYENREVIVKSTEYRYPEQVDWIQQQANYVNYLGETLNVADYIAPYVEVSDDQTKLVTVSEFVRGESPSTLYNDPMLWFVDQNLV